MRRAMTGGLPRAVSRGFTLVELLVVIVIIVIIAGVSVTLINMFFRGQGVRMGAMTVTQALAFCKQQAADKRVMHFVIFRNRSDGSGGYMEVWRDGDPKRALAPDRTIDYATPTLGDVVVPGREFAMPRFVTFKYAPQWIGIEPDGYCSFSSSAVPSGGFPPSWPIDPGGFENALNSNGEAGEIILLQPRGTRGYRMCCDVEKSSGKIRKAHFLSPY